MPGSCRASSASRTIPPKLFDVGRREFSVSGRHGLELRLMDAFQEGVLRGNGRDPDRSGS